MLDADTKGTGAEMVSLEKFQQRRRSSESASPATVLRRSDPNETAESAVAEPVVEARVPRRFRAVSVLSGEVVAEDAGAREVVEAMRWSRSVADLRVYVWEPDEEDWRPLTLRERRAIWAFR